jgi:hypothetical protein
MTREASSQPLTAEDRIQFQDPQYGICGERKPMREVSRRVYRLAPVSTTIQMLHNHVSFICHQSYRTLATESIVNPLSPELNPICYLLTLLAHDFLHVSRLRVKSLTLRLLMSYMYTYSTYS